ncbi:unnamed protein product [marine sediment metagenome]|uniref:Uncharacterized protein n=1 Tax=marine sediment metagenome TaxID=412755 RepID=X1B2R0_9ZZZZ
MNCDDKTCPWFSTQFSTGHCSHPTPDLCTNTVSIELTRPVFERLKDYYLDYCQEVYYSSECQVSLDTDDMSLAMTTLLNDLDIFMAWMRGELT